MSFSLKNRVMGLSLVLVMFAVGCSGSGSSSSSSPTLDSVGDLPKATSPVSASTSSSQAYVVEAGPLLAATTGLNLGTTTASDFTANSSLASCQMFNMSKQAISSAATGDLILCYIQSTMEAFVANSGSSVDIYDGSYHVFGLDFSGMSEEEDEGGGPDNIKFKIVKDSAGLITEFEMFACASGSQNMYLKQTIAGTDFTMNVKQSGGQGSNTYSDDISVSGTLGSSGNFSGTKTINMNMSHSWGDDGSFWGVVNFYQGATSASLDGYMNGSNSWEDETFTWTDRISGELQLIDSNSSSSTYDIGLLSIGDGAVKGEMVGSGGSETWTHTFTEGWNGDTTLEDSDAAASYITAVSEDTLPSATEPTIAFSGDEVYDCNGTVEANIVFADIGITDFSSCSALELNHNHIDCWHIIGDGE